MVTEKDFPEMCMFKRKPLHVNQNVLTDRN